MPMLLWSQRAALSPGRFTSGKGSTRMRHLTTSASQISDLIWTSSLVAIALELTMASGLYAADVTVSEDSFGCIMDWTKVRNTYIKHADPEKLKEAVRIFKDSVAN